MSSRSFAVQMENATSQVEEEIERIFKASVNEAFVSVVASTPVDTGKARNSWQAVKGQSAGPVIETPISKAGSESIDSINAAINGLNMGDAVTLYSHLDYIIPLEDGRSQQAPSGMVKRAAAAWPSIVRRNERG